MRYTFDRLFIVSFSKNSGYFLWDTKYIIAGPFKDTYVLDNGWIQVWIRKNQMNYINSKGRILLW